VTLGAGDSISKIETPRVRMEGEECVALKIWFQEKKIHRGIRSLKKNRNFTGSGKEVWKGEQGESCQQGGGSLKKNLDGEGGEGVEGSKGE